jgi:hypothetical protein
MIEYRECEQTIPYQQIEMNGHWLPDEKISNQVVHKQKKFGMSMP